MIHVEPAPEPPDFHDRVRRPGLMALHEMVGKPPSPPRTGGRPFQQRRKGAGGALITQEADLPPHELPTYWTRALPDLMRAYQQICGYSCFRIHPVTGAPSVDHMAPKSRAWDQVYEWSNYRLAASRLNARKNDFGDVLDPFHVQNAWFRLELVGFQVLPGQGLSPGLRQQIQDTIDRLQLNDFRADRAHDAEKYWERRISFGVLLEESPFVAMELRRQARLFDRDPEQALLNRVYQAIAHPPHPKSKPELLRTTGLLPNQWYKTISALINREVIQRTGRGRSTRYHAL